MFVTSHVIISQKDERLYGVLNEVYLQNIFSVTFQDESNDSSSVLISYIDATVTALNYSLIVRLKASLVRVTATVP